MVVVCQVWSTWFHMCSLIYPQHNSTRLHCYNFYSYLKMRKWRPRGAAWTCKAPQLAHALGGIQLRFLEKVRYSPCTESTLQSWLTSTKSWRYSLQYDQQFTDMIVLGSSHQVPTYRYHHPRHLRAVVCWVRTLLRLIWGTEVQWGSTPDTVDGKFLVSTR